MKILIRTIQIITALILLFLSIGMLIPEFSYQTKVEVQADRTTSYRVFTNSSLTDQWLTGFQSMEKISGEPLTEGSQWTMTIERNGETFEMKETITKVIPNQQFSFTIESDVMMSEIDVYFEQHDKKTVIRTENNVIPNGLFWKSVLVLMKSSMIEDAEATYKKLAQLIELRSEPDGSSKVQ